MTYRERRLAKADRLREWAGSNEAKSDAAHQASHDATAMIPFGQPILVGHHSQRRHERALERARRAASASVELSQKAEDQLSRAANIEAAADRAIYDDDPDAIERLREKLAKLEAERERRKQANATYRREHKAELKEMTAYQRHQAVPYPSYSISNLGGVITTTRQRLARLERERDHGPRDRMIFARFDSQCASCGAQLKKGDRIRYNRQQGARCLTCESEE